MNKIRITADSICDLPKAIIQQNDIAIMPLIVNLDGKDEYDAEYLPDKIYAFAEKTKTTPKTAARSIEDYKEFFIKHVPADGVLIHFTISSELSASHQNALIAAKEMSNVCPIDSRSLSTGTGLLILYSLKLVKENLHIDEVIKKINEKIPKIQCSFVLKDLTYLHRGGRCSGLLRLLSTTLLIKPQIAVKDGIMAPAKKFMGGFEHCVKKYVNSVLTEHNNPDFEYCFITHTRMDNPKIVDEVKQIVAARYPFKQIIETTAGGTVTSHCGPNTLGVLYCNG
jgi:DegV family protein with EDD domain